VRSPLWAPKIYLCGCMQLWLWLRLWLWLWLAVMVQIVGTFEGLHRGPVSCACLSGNGALLVTGGLDDCMVKVWKVQRKSRFPGASVIAGFTWSLPLKAALIGHTSTVTRLAVSHKYGALVSSAEDGTVLLWDLGKAVPLRTVPEKARFPYAVSALQVHMRAGAARVEGGVCRGGVGDAWRLASPLAPGPAAPTDSPSPPHTHTHAHTRAPHTHTHLLPHVPCTLQISDTTGDIVICAGPILLLTDVNGQPLAAAHAGSHIVSCALAEVPEWMDGRVVVTGHVDGMVRVWQVGFWEYGRRREVDAAIAARQHAGVSSLEAFLQGLYAEVPFCLKLLAMLDWHANPVTAVLVTQ
jgi:WD40 repeat protein